MFFSDWNEKPPYKVSQNLLWDCDLDNFDWERFRALVVERVIERGNIQDFYGAIQLYGGLDPFRSIIKNEVKYLSEKDIAFICQLFHFKKEELRCYRRKLLREKQLNF